MPLGGIAVTTRYFPLSFILAAFKPMILLDGRPVPVTGWGRTLLQAESGLHQLHVHVPYWAAPAQIGPADTTVETRPDEITELEYKVPIWPYSRGSLGPPPQPYNGVGIYLAVAAIALTLAVTILTVFIIAIP